MASIGTQDRPRASLAQGCAVAAIALLLAVKLTVELNVPSKDDVAWLLHVAEDWLDGNVLYTSLVEFNPPPIIWFSALPVLIGNALGVPALLVMPVLCALLMLGAAWWGASLLVRRGVFASTPVVCAAILAILLFVPAAEFGQREQLIAAAVLPYLALRVRPLPDGRPVPAWEAALAGVLVAVACAMKPWYAAAVILVEAVMVARGGRLQRAAILGAVVAAVAMAGVILLAHPHYVAKAVPMAIALYGDAPGVTLFPHGTLLLLAAFAVSAALWCLRGRVLADGDAMLILLLFAIGGLAAYFLQKQGWFYHRIPATAATLGALLVWLALRPPVTRRRLRGLAIPAVLAVLALALQAGNRFAPRVAIAANLRIPMETRVADLLRQEDARSYMAFSSTLAFGFPVTSMTPTVWASRFASMWAVRGELHAEASGAGGGPPSTLARRWVIHDFLTACPDIVLVDDADGIDYPAVLSAVDPVFARVWSGYTPFGDAGDFTTYRRSRPCEPPT